MKNLSQHIKGNTPKSEKGISPVSEPMLCIESIVWSYKNNQFDTTKRSDG